MLPIAPLMIEHRLMDRMIDLIKEESCRMKEDRVDSGFIDGAIDFFRTYVDLCHHAKEEKILFKALDGKGISSEHKKIMNELIEEHALARKIVERLERAKGRYLQGDDDTIGDMRECFEEMVMLYPAHIEKEDKHFFLPSMKYFTKGERDAMLSDMAEFDKKLIHQIYRDMVERFEREKGKPQNNT